MSVPLAFRILIIDDNPAIHQDFIKVLMVEPAIPELDQLSKQFFGEKTANKVKDLPSLEISTASQGQEGLEYIRTALKEGNPFALAFVDIRMPPGWDGVETIKHIWEVDPNIQIVICTAYSDYSWEETIEQLGVTDNLLMLKKPFDAVAVRQLACALTKKWQLMQETREHIHSIEERIRERTNSLQQSLSLIKATLESSAEGILVTDSFGNITDYNDKFVSLWEIPEEILNTKKNSAVRDYQLTQVNDSSELLTKLKRIDTQAEIKDIYTLRLKNGAILEQYTQPYQTEEKTSGRVWSFRDISQRVHLEEKLEHDATHDALTELPNRVLLLDRINQAISSATRHKTQVGILFFDIDRFKLINDSLGHDAGDKLLQGVAKRLQSVIRAEDTFARLGGDEFVVVLNNILDADTVIITANKLLGIIREPFNIADREITVAMSMGICLYPNDGKNATELLRNADLSMYKAKETGADKFVFYTHELNKKSLLRLEGEASLRSAIKNNEFFIVYQPQFDLLSEEVLAVEALIRWQHPTKGLILPMDFIPLAEESGLTVQIGKWFLEKVCRQNKAWQTAGYPPIRVAINITTRQIRQPDFVDMVREILKATGLSPEYLEFELTENIVLNDPLALQFINAIKEMGIQVALDDFGTGTSSLNYLRKMSINRLKIDKSFIDNIGDNKSDEILIQAIIAMAHGLKLHVLAEGVETKKQLSFLESNQCEEIQGYILGKPLSLEDISALLAKK